MRPKYAYMGFEVFELDGMSIPTGKKTKLSGTRQGVGLRAASNGFEFYNIQPIAICFLYQSRLAYYWPKKWSNKRKVLRLMAFGSYRYIMGKLTNG